MRVDSLIEIQGGLDFGLAGAPRQVIEASAPVRSVAILGDDYPDLRLTPVVKVGERVARGTPVLADRRHPELRLTSPVAGVVSGTGRGPRRSLGSLVITVDGDDAIVFERAPEPSQETIRQLLQKAGLWTAFLSRPFGRVPALDASPDAIFITAIDTNPLAGSPFAALSNAGAALAAGVRVLKHLTAGPVFFCQAPETPWDIERDNQVRVVQFEGRYPAGLPGAHIQHLSPIDHGGVVWQVFVQDVAAIGHLTMTGEIDGQRVIALAGPGVRSPRIVRVPMGASLEDLCHNELQDKDQVVLSGPVTHGSATRFLRRRHWQVSVIPKPVANDGVPVLSRWLGIRRAAPPPLVPLEAFERVAVTGIPPTPLLRALCAGDAETAASLGCLALLEEDVAPFSYLCASKVDYGPLLRSVLHELEESA